MSDNRGHRQSGGFTLLEAIVAIAVIGLALIPIVSFLSLSANALAKAADANARSFATQAAIAVMESVNPVEEPRGTLPIDEGTSVSWESQPIVPVPENPVPNTSFPAYRITFHKVRVTVSRASAPWFDFDMRKVGYASISVQEFGTGSGDPFNSQP